MKEANFKYLNQKGQKSERKVIVVEDTTDYIEGIDLTKLTADKMRAALASVKSNTFDPEQYTKVAFRRFLKRNITDLNEVTL